MAKTKRQEEIDKLTEQMNESVKSYQIDPADEMDLLDSLSRFKDYSVRNTLIARAQYQGALGVASYKDFQKLGYQVEHGEKAIYILAPNIQKVFQDEKGKEKLVKYANKKEKEAIRVKKIQTRSKVLNFRRVPVFDITQTDCPPEDYPKLYPNKPENFDFSGTEKELNTFEKALYQYAEDKNVRIESGKTGSVAKGYYVPATNEILLKDTLQQEAKIKVLLHELAHAEMHNHKKMQTKSLELKATDVIEYQAEMTAYVVSNYIGIDSEEYSQSYLASWTKKDVENDDYIQSLTEVKDLSFSMVDDLVEKYNDLKNKLAINPEEKIAKKLNFLSDSNGHNYYQELQKEVFTCRSISEVKKGKSFTDYSIELEDQQKNNFQYKIRTEKNKKEIRNEWTKEKTGKQWLNEDLKTEILKRKPSLSIDNDVPEKTKHAQDIQSYIQEKSSPELKM
ncbi:MAG: ImmA/IrrE family metallo-endopeptidase [Tetragenococcus koreensis]|nr:ImmA/IrrE family metallo-endopeptidase [Tetragenococcus koreensis]